jgi:hypothetical protein
MWGAAAPRWVGAGARKVPGPMPPHDPAKNQTTPLSPPSPPPFIPPPPPPVLPFIVEATSFLIPGGVICALLVVATLLNVNCARWLMALW